MSMLLGMNLIHADNVQSLNKLKTEKEALVLKLESYALKKKIIEMENFIEKSKVEKEKRLEREKALVQLRNDLRANRATYNR